MYQNYGINLFQRKAKDGKICGLTAQFMFQKILEDLLFNGIIYFFYF